MLCRNMYTSAYSLARVLQVVLRHARSRLSLNPDTYAILSYKIDVFDDSAEERMGNVHVHVIAIHIHAPKWNPSHRGDESMWHFKNSVVFIDSALLANVKRFCSVQLLIKRKM